MKIDNLRTDLSPQDRLPVRCEIDERVDVTEPVPVAKPGVTTVFCLECQQPIPTKDQKCAKCHAIDGIPKSLIEFGNLVKNTGDA
jgi:hypothetical protein